MWFPWVLRPVARHYGASFSRYERQGYSRFKAYEVSFLDRSTRVTAERLEAPVPTVWLWKLASKRQDAPLVSIDGWSYETLPKAVPSGPSTVGKRETFPDYTGSLRTIAEWIPMAVLSNGTIRLTEFTLDVPRATWSRGSLTALVNYTPSKGGVPPVEGTLAAQPAGTNLYQVQLSTPSLHFAAQAQVSATPGGVQFHTTNSWWGNRVEVQAAFVPGKGLPETAQLTAPAVRLPPEATGLRYYGDLVGSVSAGWHSNQFELDLQAQAQPLPVSTNFPPLHLTLHARGDTNSALIEKATLVSPWLTAQLSRGLEVHFTGKLLRERAFLDVVADLERQPWFPAKGRLTGEAQFSPSWGKLPEIDFRLSGSELGYRSVQTHSLALQGHLDWPQVWISDVQATLIDGSAVQASGTVDVDAKTLADCRFRLRGPWIKQWLPAGYDFQDMTATGTAAGPFTTLTHQVDLGITNLTAPHLKALNIQARWQGIGTALTNAQIEAAAGHSSLLLHGGFERSSTNVQVRLVGFALRTNGQPVLTLVQPAEVEFVPGEGNRNWELRTSPMAWKGQAGELEVQTRLAWPEQGTFNLHVRGVSPSLADEFLTTNLPPIAINRLDAAGGWSNGPVQFTLAADSTLRQLNQKNPLSTLRVAFESSGSAEGLALSNLVVSSENSRAFTAQASLPLSVNPAASALLQVETNKTLKLHAAANPNALLWNQLPKATGVTLVNPQFEADLAGTWHAPAGIIRLRAEKIELPKRTNEMPELSNLELEVEVDPLKARLRTGQVLVQGQRVSLFAELPLGPPFWAGLRKRQAPDWIQGRARLQIQEAELAAFEPLFPKILAPQGDLSVDLALLPGGRLEGQANIEHARTRPLGEMGPIRDIGINLRLHEHSLTLEGASARIGGATVTMSGRAILPAGTREVKGELPPFELAIRGVSVPLARSPEFVLRSDLLLAITKTNGAPPLISGAASLRDSFYLTDLQKLIPGVASPAQRPPYFSIQEPFLADWRLAIDVQGDKFLKVRSPLFNGEVSASTKLFGTLQDPIAIGDVRIDSGAVRFPFASIPVRQGVITLSSQNPYHPQLSVIGASKQFGYDIRMEVTGPIDAPIIQFNSTPPLSSEQILLMVTAGEMPQGTYTLSSQQRAQTVAVFLGRDVLSSLGIGDQAEQRLTVRSGEEISDQGRPTYNVEYKLNDRWSITGEYDRFGDYNAGFKWRVFSK